MYSNNILNVQDSTTIYIPVQKSLETYWSHPVFLPQRICIWTDADIIFRRQMNFFNSKINVNKIHWIKEKLNDLKSNALLKEKNVDSLSREINQNVFD